MKWSSIHYEYAHTVVKSIVNVLVECLRSAERSSSGAFPFFFLRAMSANGTLDGFGHDGIPGHESTRKFELRRRAVGIWRRGMSARPVASGLLKMRAWVAGTQARSAGLVGSSLNPPSAAMRDRVKIDWPRENKTT